jgi:hypothetical protein
MMAASAAAPEGPNPMERLLTLLAALSVILLVVILRSLHIRVEHSVSWLAAAATLLALSISPVPLEKMRAFLGLTEPAVALLLVVFAVFLGVVYRFSRVISELKDMNITLTQRLAILEYHLRYRDEIRP